MDAAQELAYLVQMGLDASEYRLEPGEDHDAIYYEYQARVKRLLESVTATTNKSQPRRAQQQPKSKTLSISVHGRKVRIPAEKLEYVPYKGSPTGYRWWPKQQYMAELAEVFDAQKS